MQNNNIFKPNSEDRIHYFLIGKRPESINFEIPEIFDSSCLNSLIFMPKSIIQMIDPLGWHSFNCENHIPCHINFSILFDDYSLEDYEVRFKVPSRILVIFLNTDNKDIFRFLEKLDKSFLISSDLESIYSSMISSESLKSKVANSNEILFNKLLDFSLNEFGMNFNQYTEIRKKRMEEAKEAYQEIGFSPNFSFAPSRNNNANLLQIFCLGDSDFLNYETIDMSKKTENVLKSALSLGIASEWLKLPDGKNTHKNPPLFTLILSYPYYNPDYRELLDNEIKISHKNRKNNQKQLKKIRKYRFIEQDIQNYEFYLELEELEELEESEKLKKIEDFSSDLLLFLTIANIKQKYIAFLDLMSYLHSTFEMSPAIRVPARGASLNPYISRLSPSQFKKTQSSLSLRKNLFEIGQSLADNLPENVLNLIGNYANNICSISDLPIEWLLFKDTPLAFLCDICRIPETSPTSILSQYNRNLWHDFTIEKDIIANTIVVCGATEEDDIYKIYKNGHYGLNKNNQLPYKTFHVQSKERFFELVNTHRPHLLIIDSHGDFNNKREGSYILFGKEKVTSKDIVECLPQVPLVILSCCWGTPIYGNSNTIAQAFFEKGSYSVLSTFLPISIKGGFRLYFRILKNLAYATNKPMHESWLNFISHNIRTSYFDNLLDSAFDKFGSSILLQGEYEKNRTLWQVHCMDRNLRFNVYKQTHELIIKSIKDSYREKVQKLLDSSGIIPEFMLYTHLGRGDLVKFDSWITQKIARE